MHFFPGCSGITWSSGPCWTKWSTGKLCLHSCLVYSLYSKSILGSNFYFSKYFACDQPHRSAYTVLHCHAVFASTCHGNSEILKTHITSTSTSTSPPLNQEEVLSYHIMQFDRLKTDISNSHDTDVLHE